MIVHGQWMCRNGVIHRRAEDSLKSEDRKRLRGNIKEQFQFRSDDLLPEDKGLLDDTDFGTIWRKISGDKNFGCERCGPQEPYPNVNGRTTPIPLTRIQLLQLHHQEFVDKNHHRQPERHGYTDIQQQLYIRKLRTTKQQVCHHNIARNHTSQGTTPIHTHPFPETTSTWHGRWLDKVRDGGKPRSNRNMIDGSHTGNG